jgi:hypothetical protein
MKAGFITLIWKQNDGAWNGITASPPPKKKSQKQCLQSIRPWQVFFLGGSDDDEGTMLVKCLPQWETINVVSGTPESSPNNV